MIGRGATVVAFALLFVLPFALVAPSCGRTPRPLVVDLPAGVGEAITPNRAPVERREVTFSHVVFGAVGSDGFTLPLVSPDGSMVAVQTTSDADWKALTANGEKATPVRATITIYPLRQPGLSPATTVVGDALLLGRSADGAGFLVESTREDGSRWIGKVSWTGGSPEWLAADGAVNAFATLAQNGTLAWCRRATDSRGWAIAIAVPRGGALEVLGEIPPPPFGSWGAPSFSLDGRTLMVPRLRDGVLALAAFDLTGALPTVPRIATEVHWRSDFRTTYQAIVPLRASATPEGRFPFFHPRFGRIAYWDPAGDSIAMTGPATAAVLAVDSERLLAATPRRLAVEEIPRPSTATEQEAGDVLLDAPWIPVGLASPGGAIVALPGPHDFTLGRVTIITPAPAARK